MEKVLIRSLDSLFRLMVKWTIDICSSLPTPSLKELQEINCHGSIGGAFSYMKLQEKQCVPGAYIIRQCEKDYGNFYIDIITER